ncbi:MAG: ABC transporter ATP-binding protein [Candidatus Latescibacteria bacterium]|nr:ABC transporter ATP-binding protein [Candidatus Latescibacterota bacterium]
MTPAIEVEGLFLAYGERTALDRVSFVVRPGEIFGLLGPNGGGKTTLFKILTTLLPPSQGRARVFGLDVVRDADAVRRRIGVVFQEPALDRQLTVAENLRHQGHLHGLRGQGLRERMEAVLSRLDLGERRDDLVSRLSGGLRRRADLARGMLHGPGLLLLDEPTTGLDPAARRDFRAGLLRLRERDGVTLLLTTHLMEEAEGCDRVAILDRGRLVAMDSPEALRRSVGGEVICVQAEAPERLQEAIRERFGLETGLVDGAVRLACEDGQRVMMDLLRAFGGEIASITLSRPTLEDVFIAKTGHKLRDPDEGQS